MDNPSRVFSPGGYLDSMAETALPPDGAAMVILKRLARRHNAIVGGSFICRDEDGVISDAQGKILARRESSEGPGIITAEVPLGRVTPTLDIPNGFWLHPRGAIAAFMWFYQNSHGRGWYRRHAIGRPTADQVNPVLSEQGTLQ